MIASETSFKLILLSLVLGPRDDIIVFALSAGLRGIALHVCNQEEYGMVLVPLEDHQTLQEDFPNLQNTLVELTAKVGLLLTT
jgi:hypothetical protein